MEDDGGGFFVFGVAEDAAGMYAELSTGKHSRKFFGDFGSDAMTMNFPVGARVAKESAALVERKGLPYLLQVRT